MSDIISLASLRTPPPPLDYLTAVHELADLHSALQAKQMTKAMAVAMIADCERRIARLDPEIAAVEAAIRDFDRSRLTNQDTEETA